MEATGTACSTPARPAVGGPRAAKVARSTTVGTFVVLPSEGPGFLLGPLWLTSPVGVGAPFVLCL